MKEELDELKQEKREIKRQLQLVDGIMKEDLYTAYYSVLENEEIVADRDVEIPGMEEETAVEKGAKAVVEPEISVTGMNSEDSQYDVDRQKEQIDNIGEQQIDFVKTKEIGTVDKVGWIIRKISEFGGFQNISDSVKADIFGFDIDDVIGSIRLFSDVMKRLGIMHNGDELYEEFQRIYDESVGRDIDKGKMKDNMWNKGRER